MSDVSLDLRLPVPDGTLTLRADVPMRGVTAFFGPSGTGKTRLLRSLAGVDARDSAPATGRISWGDDVWLDGAHKTPAFKRSIGYVPQRPALLPHLSVGGNLAYAAKRALPNAPAVDAVAQLLDVEPLRGRRPDGLSGGEQQRIALALALLRGPRLLLLDEPLTALDRPRRRTVLAALKRVIEDRGMAAILVSHTLEDVLYLADQTIVFAGGSVLAQGPTADVLNSIDQSEALGSFEAGRILDARVSHHDPALCLTYVEVVGQTLSMPLLNRLEPGSAVRLRVRARDVALALAPPTGISIRNCVPATLTALAAPSRSAFVEVALDLGGAQLDARITRAAAADLGLHEGMQVYALIKSISFDRRMV